MVPTALDGPSSGLLFSASSRPPSTQIWLLQTIYRGRGVNYMFYTSMVEMMGRWKCIETVDDTYVDPACADTYGCYRLYGHLLPSLNRLEHLARRPEDLRRW